MLSFTVQSEGQYYLDVRSDTCTLPTNAMREIMAAAQVGDDVYQDDPNMRKLEALAAELTGKEAALFMPSGTMANQIAIMCVTRRGDEIIVGKNSHIVVHEAGAAAVLSGVGYCMIDNPCGTISGADVDANVRVPDIHHPETTMLCLENALGSGMVVDLPKMKDAYDAAKRHGLFVHLDGARLFNAAIYLDVSVKDIAANCDSLMFCLSKGLGCPIGSLLCGDAAFIEKARRMRKLLGGGMRQTGMLAAGGMHALNNMVERLADDHEAAEYLGEELEKIPGIIIDRSRIHINLVFFRIDKPNWDDAAFVQFMYNKCIKINGMETDGTYRFVSHIGAHLDALQFIVKCVREYVTSV